MSEGIRSILLILVIPRDVPRVRLNTSVPHIAGTVGEGDAGLEYGPHECYQTIRRTDTRRDFTSLLSGSRGYSYHNLYDY
ncbi:hypothetical protein AAF712_016539, partial [Marasmius tenuissimus]